MFDSYSTVLEHAWFVGNNSCDTTPDRCMRGPPNPQIQDPLQKFLRLQASCQGSVYWDWTGVAEAQSDDGPPPPCVKAARTSPVAPPIGTSLVEHK